MTAEQLVELVQAEAFHQVISNAPKEYLDLVEEGAKDAFDAGVLFGIGATLIVLRRLGVELDKEKLEMPS